ncbi:MAG: hypothetical protein H6618_05340 [Deltaproteobacteria bacterium]|nr:hypothetical protein [Deltaproteobacteria bacterium]
MTSEAGKRSGKKRTLRSFLIEPFSQIKFGLYMIGTSFAFILASGIMFWNAFDDQYTQLISIFSVVDPEELWELRLNTVFETNAIRILLFFLIFMTVTFSIAVSLTHRYYGPLVSIDRFIDDLIRGKYSSRIHVRSKDELQDLAKKLNQLAEVLERQGSVNKDKSPSAPEKKHRGTE